MNKGSKEDILKKIQSGEVAMRPRWHFVLKTVLAILGMVILTLVLIYLLSFIVFVLKYTGVIFVPAFGMHGVISFLFSIPWLLMILAVVFIVVLEVLVKRFSFGYRRPLLYSVLGIVLLTLLGTFFVLKTPMHDRLLDRVHHGRPVPGVGAFYRSYGERTPKDVMFGEITEASTTELIIVDSKNTLWTVHISADTKLPRQGELKEGDEVFVFGERGDGVIRARGVRKAYDRLYLYPEGSADQNVSRGFLDFSLLKMTYNSY